ncbi:MAG: hypothetical protein IID32_10315, partial [Planctomycetes bacterium]|nr:hypothetical protein [Planctomycetota bacterium]
HNLAKVMLIKDEIYVATMLTDSEKYKRDRRRFNVNLSQGDRISYRHYNVPEVHLFGRIYRLPPVRTRDWQLKILSRLKFLRPILFKHACESDFRDWYEQELVEKLEWHGPKDYKRWVAILSVPETVTGFREIRYPKIEAARARGEKLLKTDPELFELEPAPSERAVSAARVQVPLVKRSYERFSV